MKFNFQTARGQAFKPRFTGTFGKDVKGISVPCQIAFSANFSSTGNAGSWARRRGWISELPTDDPEFDEEIKIDGRDARFAALVLRRVPELRAQTQAILSETNAMTLEFKPGLASLFNQTAELAYTPNSDAYNLTPSAYEDDPKAAEVEHMVDRLADICGLFEGANFADLKPRPVNRVWPVLRGFALFVLLPVFGLLAFASLDIFLEQKSMPFESRVMWALPFTLSTTLAFMWLIGRLFRGRAVLMDRLAAAGMWAFLVAFTFMPNLFTLANWAMDQSDGTPYTFLVSDTHIEEKSSSRAKFELSLRDVDHNYPDFRWSVSASRYKTIAPGVDCLKIWIHPGALGMKWPSHIQWGKCRGADKFLKEEPGGSP